MSAPVRSHLEWALHYVRRGLPVYPLHTVVNGCCTCGNAKCERPAKHPRTEHGKNDASTDEKQVRQWWQRWPGANIGVVISNKYVVVDVDPRHGGEESLARFVERYGPLADTRTARTGGNGLHFWYQHPGAECALRNRDLKDEGFPGLEIRTDSIIATPSLHASGVRYRWEKDVAAMPLPAALLALAREPEAWPARPAASVDGLLAGWKEAVRAASPIVEVIGERVQLKQVGRAWRGLCPFHDDHTPSLDVSAEKGSYVCRSCGAGGDVFRFIEQVDKLTFPLALEQLAQRAGIPKPVARESRPVSHAVPTRSSEAESGAAGRKPPSEGEPWPEPLAAEAFHGPAGAFVQAIAPESEADPAAILLQLLAGFGCVVNRGPYFRAESDAHFGNLFIGVIGETARGRKGSSWGHVRRLLEKLDPEWSRHRVVHGLSTGEGLIAAVRDESTRTVRGETVTEPGEADKRLLIVETELGRALKSMQRDGNNLSSVLRCAWDRGDLSILTRGSPMRATGALVALIGHCTRYELRALLAETDTFGGLANRVLWTCARRSKLLPEGGRVPDEVFDHFAELLRPRLERAWRRGEREVTRDAEARALWFEEYPRLTCAEEGVIGAVLSRAETQVVRLSLLYALLDGADAVAVAHLRAALAVWDYCEQSARHVFGRAVEPVRQNAALAVLLPWLRAHGGAATPSEVADYGLRRYRGKAELAERDLSELAKAGLGAWDEPVAGKNGGRPPRRFRLLPAGGLAEKPQSSAGNSEVSPPPPRFGSGNRAPLEPFIDFAEASAGIMAATLRGKP